jgi:hypothetical protein
MWVRVHRFDGTIYANDHHRYEFIRWFFRPFVLIRAFDHVVQKGLWQCIYNLVMSRPNKDVFAQSNVTSIRLRMATCLTKYTDLQRTKEMLRRRWEQLDTMKWRRCVTKRDTLHAPSSITEDRDITQFNLGKCFASSNVCKQPKIKKGNCKETVMGKAKLGRCNAFVIQL